MKFGGQSQFYVWTKVIYCDQRSQFYFLCWKIAIFKETLTTTTFFLKIFKLIIKFSKIGARICAQTRAHGQNKSLFQWNLHIWLLWHGNFIEIMLESLIKHVLSKTHYFGARTMTLGITFTGKIMISFPFYMIFLWNFVDK